MRAGYGPMEVLRGVDLSVGQGELVALLGVNGAGKSTFINAVCGLLAPAAGEIRFLGNPITGSHPKRIVAAGLIQVPEGRRIFPNMTVRENLELGGYRRARARRGHNLDHAFATFPRLRERQAQWAGTLSGGEQQMLAIGRAMMAEPKLLILDEPSLGLSPRLVGEMFALIRRLHADGMAILLVEQNVVQSLDIADRAYVLDNGAVVQSGVPSAIMNIAEVKRAFLGS